MAAGQPSGNAATTGSLKAKILRPWPEARFAVRHSRDAHTERAAIDFLRAKSRFEAANAPPDDSGSSRGRISWGLLTKAPALGEEETLLFELESGALRREKSGGEGSPTIENDETVRSAAAATSGTQRCRSSISITCLPTVVAGLREVVGFWGTKPIRLPRRALNAFRSCDRRSTPSRTILPASIRLPGMR